jgi:hypothetical protein
VAKNSNWKLYLFIFGMVLSSLFAAGAIGVLVFITIEISWALCALILGACVLPVLLFGLPYFNSKFRVSYSKEGGLKIEEERRQQKLGVFNERRKNGVR